VTFVKTALDGWEGFWLSGREAADLSLVKNIAEGDHAMVLYLLWSVAIIYEMRRLLMSEFSLHIVGTKNVGKSTVIQEVFKLKDITCGSRVSQSTVVPVAYKVAQIPHFSIVDQPGSDDMVSMASRINVQTLQLGTHFLLLTDFRAAQFTSFVKLLLAIQCAQVPFTVVFTRCDEYIEEYASREVFESELQALATRLNEKLKSLRKTVEKIRNKGFERNIVGVEDEGVGSSLSNNSLSGGLLELDKDISEQAMGLSDAQLSAIREEDPSRWLKVAVNPRKYVMKELESRGQTLADYGILDCAQFRSMLTTILEDYEAGLDLRLL